MMAEIYDIRFVQVCSLSFPSFNGFHIPTCQNYFSVCIYM